MIATSVTVDTYADWRNAARQLLHDRVPPKQVIWTSAADGQALLFDVDHAQPSASARAVMMPNAFVRSAELVARHSEPKRWNLLYRIAWRIANGKRHLLEIETDDDVVALNAMRKAVEKDIYRMRAFVRFRKVESPEGERYIAWYEPEHRTLDANGEFFVNRFGSMRWAILTPYMSLVWDLKTLQQGPGLTRSHAPSEDELEELWRLYYATIYNPARLNLTAMRAQLPVHRWSNLPEARTIPELVRISRGRVADMAASQPPAASNLIQPGASWDELRAAIRDCDACGLCRRATQPVWGEGDLHARVMLVGEQPGDEEDRSGRPFVGPAGKVLDSAIREAGLDRSKLYVTNAVKAFSFEERGKRRIHQTPRSREISACKPWLMAEIEAVQPDSVLCLGASAAESVLGRKVRIGSERGLSIAHHGIPSVRVTYHPSAILRAPDASVQQELYSALVADLAQSQAAPKDATFRDMSSDNRNRHEE